VNHIRRIVAALATVVGALLTFIAVSPAALAIRVPPPGGYDGMVQAPPHLAPGHILHQPAHEIPSAIPAHTIVTGGMPGWQITLIAVAAAVVAAAVAVILDRARAARRHLTAPAA
jgi:hypothetical protein